MNHRLSIIGCVVVVLLVALSALRYVDFFTYTYLDENFSSENFNQKLKPEQRILLGKRIDINKADEKTFEILHLVGPKLARRIVEDRELNGPFRSVEDMSRVYGIGPKIVQKNRVYLTTFACPNAEK